MFVFSLDDIPQNSKICIYGKGLRAEHLQKFINRFGKNIEVVCFIDSLDLEDFIKSGREYDFIVIASVFWQEIKETLNKHQITGYKILASEFAGFMQESLDYLEINEKYSPKVPEILEIFKNDEHKKLYELIYNFRAGNEALGKIINYALENLDNLKNHYLEFLVKDKIETFIDGGVFDGSSTDRLIKELKNIKNVFGFEPLKNKFNFDYSEVIDTKNLARFEVLPLGLWHKSETIGFSICNGGSAIDNQTDSGESIETISLDEFVKENDIPKVDFIKMDIEDAELNALKGGINTIKKDRSQIAVCIYHSLEQFVEIPLFLKSHLENYSFYLGHYSCCKNETVLYAIPKELA